jgi:hypothetical protein
VYAQIAYLHEFNHQAFFSLATFFFNFLLTSNTVALWLMVFRLFRLQQRVSFTTEALKAQRKAREMKAVSGFLAVDFLCVSVSLWLMVFRLLRLQQRFSG